jgi:hypothetical protein
MTEMTLFAADEASKTELNQWLVPQLFNYGLPTILLVLLLFGLWRLCVYLGSKLFGDDKGLVTLWVTSQISLMKAQEETSRENAQALRDLRDSMTKVVNGQEQILGRLPEKQR